MKLSGNSVSNLEDLLDPNQRVLKEEDWLIVSQLTAMYVHFKHPEMTVLEVFSALEDLDFIKQQIREIMEEINGNGGPDSEVVQNL